MPARAAHALRGLATVALAIAVAAVEARSQSIAGADVRQGTPLLVYVRNGPPRESWFAYESPSALHVRERCDSCTGVLAIPWRDVTRIDARVAGPRSGRRMLVGGLAGASATVVALAIVMGAGGSRCDWNGGSCPALGFAQAAPLIVLSGTGLGMMIGSQMRQWRWVQVR